jgi:caspase domain-containing protein
MKRCAVLIGVDRTGGLPTLAGAAKNAHDLESWCISQSITTQLFTDEKNGKVTIADISNAIASFDPRVYTQLIVYFAGHGILKANDSEYWLLSDAPVKPYEAVNVALSATYARSSGFKNVVFISDACRSIPNTLQLTRLLGTQVFPNQQYLPNELDSFYATAPGDPALEVGIDTTKAFGGVFTGDLLDGMKGLVSGVPEQLNGQWVVTARGLKPYLLQQVPLSAAKIDPKYRQIPEVRPESSLPLFLAQLPNWTPPPSSASQPILDSAATPSGPSEIAQTIREMRDQEPLVKWLPKSPKFLKKRLSTSAAVQNVLYAKGREGFESQAGFSIIGAPVSGVWTTTGICEPEEFPFVRGRQNIRVRGTGPTNPHLTEAGSVLIQFLDGRGTMLAIWPGFVGTVLVENHRVVNVNYTPSEYAPSYNEYKQNEKEIDLRRAHIAVLARNGRFKINPQNAHLDADTLRHFKRFDPTLGLYAAYAYAQVGASEQVNSVLSYMRQDLGDVPFDVALLARKLGDSGIPRVPFAPMLTQGWSLIDPDAVQLPEPVLRARASQVPSLWTTLEPAGVEALATLFASGEQRVPV